MEITEFNKVIESYCKEFDLSDHQVEFVLKCLKNPRTDYASYSPYDNAELYNKVEYICGLIKEDAEIKGLDDLIRLTFSC